MNMLYGYVARQDFEPGLLGLFTNPFYLARRGLLRAIRPIAGHVVGRTLDVGCGKKPYAHLFRSSEYVGIEIDTAQNRAAKRADLYYDGRTLPFEPESFDSVVCSQVLEHVFEPEAFVAELRRVLRPRGVLLLTTPFAWDEHEQPFDYARYSSFGLRDLVERRGFEVVAQSKTLADFSVVAQLANAYLYKVTLVRSRWINLASRLVLMAPVNMVGAILAAVLPGNGDLYLDNVMLARRMPGSGASRADSDDGAG